MKTKQVLSCLSLAFFLSFCSTEKKSTPAAPVARVNSPFSKELLARTSYSVPCDAPSRIRCASGTEIKIPAHAFTDLKGNPIQGEVSVQFREFHSNAEIIASGIPMKFSEGGKVYDFESAGMFEIGAECNGEVLKLAPGKSLNIELVSNKADSNFNFYTFDTAQGRWIELSRNLAVNTPGGRLSEEEVMAKIEDELQDEEPVEPQKATQNDRVFDLAVDYGKYPELEEFGDILWKYVGRDPASDPSRNSWALADDLDNFELEPDPSDPNVFVAVFSRGGKKLRSLLTPVLSGLSYTKAMDAYRKRKAKYEAKVAARKSELSRAESNQKFSRALRVYGMGIYNCDRFARSGSIKNVAARVSLKGKGDVPNGYAMYLICNSFVVQYSSGSSITFDEDADQAMLLVLEDDKYAVISSDEFRRLMKHRSSSEPAELRFTPSEDKLSDLQSLESVLLKL